MFLKEGSSLLGGASYISVYLRYKRYVRKLEERRLGEMLIRDEAEESELEPSS